MQFDFDSSCTHHITQPSPPPPPPFLYTCKSIPHNTLQSNPCWTSCNLRDLHLNMLDKQVKGPKEWQKAECSIKAYSGLLEGKSELTYPTSRVFNTHMPKASDKSHLGQYNPMWFLTLILYVSFKTSSILGNMPIEQPVPCDSSVYWSEPPWPVHGDNASSLPFALWLDCIFCSVLPASLLILNLCEQFTCRSHPPSPSTHTWQTQLKHVVFPNFMIMTFFFYITLF